MKMLVCYYCLFCKTGRERQVGAFLEELGYKVVASFAERRGFHRGVETRERRALLPGYVIFRSDGAISDWTEIEGLRDVCRVLRYGDGRAALRGKDLECIRWLAEQGGVFGISKVMRVGTKIVVLEGPLKDFEGSIVNVRLRQRCVKVRPVGIGVLQGVWVSCEVVEPWEEGARK